MSSLTFGAGNLFTWTGAGDGHSWNLSTNWNKTALPYGEVGGASTYPGAIETGDYARFDIEPGVPIDNVPTCTLGRLEVTYLAAGARPFIFLEGLTDGVTITMRSPSTELINEGTQWVVKVDEQCLLSLNTLLHRVKMVCMPRAHFWQKNDSFFFPALYQECDNTIGFILKAEQYTGLHAEYIQQVNAVQDVEGWVEYYLDDNNYHFICPPITSSDWNVFSEFAPPNDKCRKPNSLCVFDGDYVRRFLNGTPNWDVWLGNMITCWDPRVDIKIGQGVEYYGNPANHPGGMYAFYGYLNSAVRFRLPVDMPGAQGGAQGWCFIGNPFPSAVTFAEPSGLPTAGPGWDWDLSKTEPWAFYWDNSLTNDPTYGKYHYYNWFTGLGNGPLDTRRILPRSQGFMVHVADYSPNLAPGLGSDIYLGNLARVFRGISQIGKSIVANNMTISLNDVSGKSIDDAIIAFRDDVTSTDFNPILDGRKMYNEVTDASQIYFRTSDDVDACVRVLKLAVGNIVYPLNLKVSATGTYSLNVSDISTFSPNTSIKLLDNKTNTTVDLKVNPVYTFTATAGDDDARFNLYFSDVLYGINKLDASAFNVYSFDKSIFIQNNDLKNASGSVMVYDMIGKQMIEENVSGATTRINTNLNTGFYIVSVKTDNGVYTQKVYIK